MSQILFTWVTWHIHMCHACWTCCTWVCAQSYVSHDLWGLIYIWDVTHSYLWHDAFWCVTWRVHMCTHMCHMTYEDSFICGKWRMQSCDLTQFWCVTRRVHMCHTCSTRCMCVCAAVACCSPYSWDYFSKVSCIVTLYVAFSSNVTFEKYVPCWRCRGVRARQNFSNLSSIAILRMAIEILTSQFEILISSITILEILKHQLYRKFQNDNRNFQKSVRNSHKFYGHFRNSQKNTTSQRHFYSPFKSVLHAF